MGCSCMVKLMDAVVILFFLFLAIVSPLFDVQIAVPGDYYPKQLVDLKAWYINYYGDYLVSETPPFFVGLIRLQFLLLWPLSIAALFGFASGKSWYTTACFIFGFSFLTSMAAIIGELVGSGRASGKLLILYSTFMGVGVVAILRGLIPFPLASTNSKRAVVEERGKKLTDGVLFLFFLVFAIVAPLFDAQSVLPAEYYPKQLVDLKSSYAKDFGDYLVSENPHFFVALVWVELFLLWPLSIANLFALATAKSWYRTTSLVFGVSCFTSMAAIMGELVGSGRASDKLLMIYYPFMAVALLAALRGLIPCAHNSTAPVKRHALETKKRS